MTIQITKPEIDAQMKLRLQRGASEDAEDWRPLRKVGSPQD